MVIVDTTVWIDYFRGLNNPETDWLDAEIDRQRLGLTDIILCEVLQGVRDESTAASVEGQLLRLEVFEAGGGAAIVRTGAGESAHLSSAPCPAAR